MCNIKLGYFKLSLEKYPMLEIIILYIFSDISGITLLAVPADIYINGSAWVTSVIATIFMGIVIIYVFLPVFYTLQVTSSYEYLKIRFSNRICVMASFIFAIMSILFIPVVIFIPALALNQGAVNIYHNNNIAIYNTANKNN